MSIRLTQYSHGAGCGCKISPNVLSTILDSQLTLEPDPNLLVGHGTRDDAAVYDLGNDIGIISTTDFFMPIVDDPFDFGRIAVTNAISDIYAMGGTPIMAIAVLGWPVEKLSADVARTVVDGGRQACAAAGIRLAGGHSIDSPEPIFGAAVTGRIDLRHLKRNDTAKAGDLLFLTKPLGIGVLTTAEKRQVLEPRHSDVARDQMCIMNSFGVAAGASASVHAMTDVTGFGLAGHLLEMCQGSNLRAIVELEQVPLLQGVDAYIQAGCSPGGTKRNFDSYGHLMQDTSPFARSVLCDPQTSGGLLIAVDPDLRSEFESIAGQAHFQLLPIGQLLEPGSGPVLLLE